MTPSSQLHFFAPWHGWIPWTYTLKFHARVWWYQGVQYCHTDSLTLGLCYITIMELAVHQFLPLGREVPTALPFAPPLENNHTGERSLLAPPQSLLLWSSVLSLHYYKNTWPTTGLTTRHYRAEHGTTWQATDRSEQVISSLLLHITYLPKVSSNHQLQE